MLIDESSKKRLSAYLTDIVINFIRITNRRGLLDVIILCSRDKDSEEFLQLKEMLSGMFLKNIDDRELLLAYQEIDVLMKKSSSSNQHNDNFRLS